MNDELARLRRIELLANRYFSSDPGSAAERRTQQELVSLLHFEGRLPHQGEMVAVDAPRLERLEALEELVQRLAQARGSDFADACRDLLDRFGNGGS